jgi:hypothetical protein
MRDVDFVSRREIVLAADALIVGQDCILRADSIGLPRVDARAELGRLKIGRRMQSCPTVSLR